MQENNMKKYSKMNISGNIIKEVSEKLPNMFIALNELIKNSYDACSESVEITFNSAEKILYIKDYGKGMDKNDIDILLSMAESKKKYGTKSECGRIIQGSKGLGYLSTFKFGKKVYWETTKNNTKYYFNIDMDLIEKEKNVSDLEILVESSSSKEENDSGTLIKIIMNDNTVEEFINTFINENNMLYRILYSSSDKNFVIKVNFDNKIILETESESVINPKFSNKILYRVKYNNKNEQVEFFHNGHKLFEKKFNLNSTRFSIDLDLEIYHLSGDTVDNADPMFIFKSSTSRILAPLVYINNSIFNSQDLFDPNITRNIKNTIVLPQIAGKINIYSDDKEIEFNSERTQLVTSSFSKELNSFLMDLNIFIQTHGSDRKFGLNNYNQIIINDPKEMSPLDGDNYEDNLDLIKLYCINPKFRLNDSIETKIVGKNIEIYFTDKLINKFTLPKLKKDMTYPVEISLKQTFIISKIPSAQINLKDFIIFAKDSKLKDVTDDIEVVIEGKTSSTGILESVNVEKTLLVEYTYDDKNTGKSVETLRIKFEKINESNILTNADKPKLIKQYSKLNYSIQYNYYAATLTDVVNELYLKIDSNPEYLLVIATSLRCIYDLSIQTLISNNISPLNIKQNNSLESNVNAVINLLSSKVRKEISINTGINIDNLNTLITIENGSKITKDFGNLAKISNLGAHSSNSSLTTSKIEDIGISLSYFMVFVNELIYNTEINKIL